MSLHDDLASDYALREDLETVSVQDISAATTTIDTSVSATGAGETRNESGDTENIEQFWTIFAKSISFVPSIGDIITDAAGAKWTIASVQTVQIGTVDYQYGCVTKKQV